MIWLSPDAGFTVGEPWIKVNPNYKDINVEKALNDKDSVFYFYQRLIKLRKEHLVFVYGDYQPILEAREEVYAYIREYENESLLFIGNFSGADQKIEVHKEFNVEGFQLLISNYTCIEEECALLSSLRPYEVRVYLL